MPTPQDCQAEGESFCLDVREELGEIKAREAEK